MTDRRPALRPFLKGLLEEVADVSYPSPTPFFLMARAVKGYFPVGTGAEAAFDQIAPIVRELGGWPETFGGDVPDDEAAYAWFTTTWEKVRYLPGESPLSNALAMAQTHPLATPRGKKRPMPGYDRFVSLAGWLQVAMGDRSIMLPCHAVAEVLGTSPNMVSTWTKWAIADGFLRKTKDHAFHSEGRSTAAEYRFEVRCCEMLAKVARRGSGLAFDLAELTGDATRDELGPETRQQKL